MSTIREIREKANAYIKTATSILDTAIGEKRSLTTAEQRDVDGLKEKTDALLATIGRHDQVRDLQEDMTRLVGHPGTGMKRSSITPSGDPRIITGEVRMADHVRGTYPAEYDGLSLGKFIRGYVTGNWDGAEGEQRAMAEGTVGAGGAMVPTPLSAGVIDAMRNKAAIFQAGAVIIPMDAATLKMARLKTDPTAAWTAENTTITASDGEFEAVTFTARKLAALVKCSIELIEDAPNAHSVIENALGQVLALEMDRVGLYGSGVAPEPKGLSIYANTVVPEVLMAADGATIASYDKLSDGYFTVVENNITPTVAIYAPRTAKQLDQLKEGTTNAPLTAPPSWAGLKKLVSNQVSIDLAQGGTPNGCSDVLIGDYSAMGVGLRTRLVIEASRVAADGTNGAFTDGQVWIRAYLRGDVQLLRPKAFCVVRGLKA
ncbi:MAG TPA: phage major capsid protein [Clostridia bacterium]|nr:phage major capsid protein [Clostridia bacterium]HWR35359.1 phage major capsid protein [Clostridia bacterium]